jgi:hypothetical protein
MENIEKSFQEMTKPEQRDAIIKELKEIKEYFGSWDLLRDVIHGLEWNENEANYTKHLNDH